MYVFLFIHFLHINTHATHNSSIRCEGGLALESQLLNSLRWPIYIINSLWWSQNYLVILPHRRGTTFSLETDPLYQMINSMVCAGHFGYFFLFTCLHAVIQCWKWMILLSSYECFYQTHWDSNLISKSKLWPNHNF